jgi:hypothetical protein
VAEALQQTQTLSLRISDALRQKLEDIRQLIATRKGENVSTSEIAKHLLESARQERYEVVELLRNPAGPLVEIRRKGEAGQLLSRAEWTVLAYFVQQGCQAFSKNPISRETFIGLLEAFQAIHALRPKRSDKASFNKDDYYLKNLPSECRPAESGSEPATADMVRRTVAETIRRVRRSTTTWNPGFAARNLYVLLDSDTPPGGVTLNETLAQYWPVLWRAAARGHYFERREPVHIGDRWQAVYQPAIPSLTEGGFALSFARGTGNDLSLLISFPGERGPMYPLASYPTISEFRAMVTGLPKVRWPEPWEGEHFFGYTVEQPGKENEFWFRARDNGITFGFTIAEWKAIQQLFNRAWALLEVSRTWNALSLEYGEL